MEQISGMWLTTNCVGVFLFHSVIYHNNVITNLYYVIVSLVVLGFGETEPELFVAVVTLYTRE